MVETEQPRFAKPAMTDKRFQETVDNIAAKGQITFGDVRRLQRGCLPTGISSRDELETLISLNAKIARADRAWAQWLVPAVVGFVATGQGYEPSVEEPVSKWVDCLLAAPPTNLSRRIARQIRRELARLCAIEPTGATQERPQRARVCNVQQPSGTGVPENNVATVWPEMMLGPTYRAAIQVTARSLCLAA